MVDIPMVEIVVVAMAVVDTAVAEAMVVHQVVEDMVVEVAMVPPMASVVDMEVVVEVLEVKEMLVWVQNFVQSISKKLL